MERINVTKTFLPPLDEYQSYLNRIWTVNQLTNQGPLLSEFESKTSSYLGVKQFHFVNNGTLALQIALKSLNIDRGEIITTPFSYAATVSAILWERCDPVFVDIDPESLCIDPNKIESAITKRTRAIMPVHVYGYPCDIDKIEAIAEKHNLKTIYDGAHAFGVKYQGRSLLNYGDISICSFHATKPFHTIEGGCIIPRDKGVSNKIEYIKRFGHDYDDHLMLGINAKASEFQAAMGLCNLSYIDEIIRMRKAVALKYDKKLKNLAKTLKVKKDVKYNHAYYPIVLQSESQLLKLQKHLNNENYFPRRYFYPSLNQLPYLETRQDCPISEDISKRILCLPIYSDLENDHINKITRIISEYI